MAADALLTDERAALDRIFATLTAASANPNKVVTIAKGDIAVVLAVASRWPSSVRFPGPFA